MKTRNGSDNAEPKAASGGATAPFEPVKALENVSMLVGGNSRPIIGDRNDGRTIAVRNLDGHLTRVTAMFNGIVDKIGNRIKQEISLTCDEYWLISDEAEMPATFFRRSVEELHDLARELGHVH
jgi:hypothetical protein